MYLFWRVRSLTKHMDHISLLINKNSKVLKYLISGGSAAVVNLSVLYVSTDILHVWYLASSVLANILAFFVSFFLQKFWTFNNASVELVKKQLALYLLVAVINLGINTLLMFMFVEYVELHYLLAQIVTSGLIAIESFFVYQYFIFIPRVTKE